MNTQHVEAMPGAMSLDCGHSQWLEEETVSKRKVLLITTGSLIGGVRMLLAQLGDRVRIEVVPTLRSAFLRGLAAPPDVWSILWRSLP